MQRASPPPSRAGVRSGARSYEPRQMMRHLPPPRRPIVRDVVTPKVELVRDALLDEQRREALRRVERARRVLPLALSADENQRGRAPEPVEVVPVEMGDVVHRVVEVDGVAALAATLDAHVIDAAQADRDREQIGALEAEVRGVVSAERRSRGEQLVRLRVGLDERDEPREHPPLVVAVAAGTLFERKVAARPALAVERRRAVELEPARLEELAEGRDHATVLPVPRLAVLGREREQRAAVVAE